MTKNGTSPSDQPEQFGREELRDIRYRARYFKDAKHFNSAWKRAFERLGDAADILDAFIARTKE